MRIQSEIKSIRKFIPVINKQSKKYKVDRNALISIAILENINRPFWIRFFERKLFKLIKIETYGLMQVSSKNFLDDNRSIETAAKIISKLHYKNNLRILGKQYNGSDEYGICLEFVFNELKTSNIEIDVIANSKSSRKI